MSVITPHARRRRCCCCHSAPGSLCQRARAQKCVSSSSAARYRDKRSGSEIGAYFKVNAYVFVFLWAESLCTKYCTLIAPAVRYYLCIHSDAQHSCNIFSIRNYDTKRYIISLHALEKNADIERQRQFPETKDDTCMQSTVGRQMCTSN